jgi:hypothetical protein
VLASLIIKTAMMPQLQANRMMRELKRLELQIAMGRKN